MLSEANHLRIRMILFTFCLAVALGCLPSALQAQNVHPNIDKRGRVLRLLSADESRTVRVVNNKCGGLFFELHHYGLTKALAKTKFKIWDAAISPNEKYIATAGRDTSCRLWDARTGKLVRVIVAQQGMGADNKSDHVGYVWSVAFSPNGSLLATGGHDGKVRIWRVKDGKELKSFDYSQDDRRSGLTEIQNLPGLVVQFESNNIVTARSSDESIDRKWRFDRD